MSGATPTFGFPYPTGTDRVMDGDNAIEALARAIESVLVARGFPGSLTVPGNISGGAALTVPGAATVGSLHSGSILSNGGSGEITTLYGGGGLAIAQGGVATHPNGVVLWVSGAGLYARMVGGNDVRIA
jgi:hypothetical protein